MHAFPVASDFYPRIQCSFAGFLGQHYYRDGVPFELGTLAARAEAQTPHKEPDAALGEIE